MNLSCFVLIDYEYDDFGRQVAVIGPAVDVLIAGVPTSVRHRMETVYDAQGRRGSVIDNIMIDPATGELHVNAPTPRETVFEYDAFNRVVETTFADDTTASAGFDEFGRRVSETDQLGRTRTFEFDEQGRLVAVELPQVPDPANGGAMTHPRYEYAYDALGNHVSIIDPLGRETVFAYDEQGRQLTRTLPIGVSTTGDATDFLEQKFYDDMGRLDHEVSFEGRVMQYVYSDEAGGGERLLEKRYFEDVEGYDDGNGTPEEVVAYVYDAFGRPVEVTDANGTTEYTYDMEGRVAQVDSPQGVIDYTYDDLGRLTETATENTFTQYSYDVLNRLAAVTAAERFGETLETPEVTSYVYDLIGQLDLVVSPNSVVADYDYDVMGHVETLTHFVDADSDLVLDETEVIVAQFEYEYNDAGQRISADEHFDTDNDGDFDVTHEFDWDYDALDRLIEEIHNGPGTDDDYTTAYVMDFVGNRVEMTTDSGDAAKDRTVTYTYDANDRLLTETSNAVTGDDAYTVYSWGNATGTADGEATEQTGKKVWEGLDGTGDVIESVTYVYNLQGRMSQATIVRGGDTTVLDYLYDHTGIRVQQTETVNAGTPVVHDYLVDANNPTGYQQVLEEYVDEELDRSYTLGYDVLAQASRADPGPGDPTVYRFLYDAHGSTRGFLNALGAIVERYTFDAYGNNLAGATASTLTQQLYSGEAFDPAIGMQYLRARYYQPERGSFISFDSWNAAIGDPQSFHKYGYANSNPVTNIDPTGMFSFTEMLVNMAITTIITEMVVTAVGGILSSFILNFLPPWVAPGIEALTPSAIIIGGSVNREFSLKRVPLEVEGGFEFVYSPTTGGSALFASWVFGGIASSKGGGGSQYTPEVSFGFAYNTRNSDIYESNWFKGNADVNFSFPFRRLPTQLRNRLKNLAVEFLLTTVRTPLDLLHSTGQTFDYVKPSQFEHYINLGINMIDRLWLNIAAPVDGSTDWTVIFDWELGQYEEASGIGIGGAGTIQVLPRSEIVWF